MKKLSILILALMLAVVGFTQPSEAAMQDFWAKVYSWDGTINNRGQYELTEITSGVTYVVMMRNSMATLETLYYYDTQAMTSLTNPVSGTNFASDTVGNDQVQFRTDPTETNDTYVDLIVVDQAGGYSAFVEDFTIYKHSIIIDERPNEPQHGVAFIYTTGSSSEIDTGIEFDRATLIEKMMIEVGTAFETNVGIMVGLASGGTNGDPDGFISGETLATAGWHNPLRVGVDLTGYSYSSGGEVPSINPSTIGNPAAGTWLGHFAAGTSDTGTIIGGTGIFGINRPDQLLIYGTWEQSLTYTFSTTAASTGWGMIHFWFTRIR